MVSGGAVFPAWGTRKSRTVAADSFTAASGGPLGFVRGETGHIEVQSRPRPPLRLEDVRVDSVRVDVAACYPGADAAALHAFAAQGAQGLVLEATGAGNASHAICEAVRELTARGVVVVTPTRVESGPVTALYGNAGGQGPAGRRRRWLGLLRPPQVRILMAVLLAVHRDPRTVRTELKRHVGG
jgi:L-asparaginase